MRFAAWRIALAYLLLGSAWIIGSDRLLLRLGDDGFMLGQTTKGLLFVVLGSILIYVLAARELREKRTTAAERERLERRLAAAARFEAIGQLTGGIAHDFNNLITAISGNIDAYLGHDPPRGRPLDELREARRSADRAAELTRQLLAFGRRQVLRPERVDVNAVILDMEPLLTRLTGPAVETVLELDEGLRAVVVDPGRLEQVVMNLAINARDAMPDGGRLVIRTRNRHVDADTAQGFPFPFVPGDYVRLDVSDTGVGIGEEIQHLIFEPFFTTKPKDVGTGLGLSTVYGIVKQSGGYVTVTSRPGEGSTFHVFLPMTSEAPTTPPEPTPAEEQPRATGTETVLVVEDDMAVRSLVMRVLQKRGFAVLEAMDGREALEVLKEAERRIDVLITDAVMPEMTGTELIEAARASHPRMRTLLISGYTEGEFNVGSPYLAKPFTPDQLVTRVREVLDA